MARRERVISESGIYHIMMRGINKQQIFYDDEDNQRFIFTLDRYKTVSEYSIYAYCLMGNHVHLLIKVEKESLGKILKRICSSYVYWYNGKYQRVGHLFQERYKSEAIKDEAYLFAVLKYILMNPVKAGICEKPEDYSYSSAKEYCNSIDGITDTSFILEIINRKNFIEMIRKDEDENIACLEIGGRYASRKTDIEAKAIIEKEFGTLCLDAGKSKERESFSERVKLAIDKGVSIRQFSRLTGVSKKIVETSLKNKDI